MLRRAVLSVAVVLLAAAFTAPAAAGAPARVQQVDPGVVYEDLSEGWEGAGACLAEPHSTRGRCWDTEAKMDAWIAANDAAAALANSGAVLSRKGFASRSSLRCSSWLKIYEHKYHGGRVLQFRDRGLWQNLAPYGFDNKTSSWKVGACAVRFAKGSSGSGSTLWQGAWWSSNASSSWNDTISSLYLT